MNKEKYYITTAIAYTSRKPHIGNSYEIVLTDAIARLKRMQGYDVYFLTGTDEHGQKIEDDARAQGVEPQAYVDKVAGQVRDICDKLNTSYDGFIRTTDPMHEKAVQNIFAKLYEQDDIYKSHYEGWYCVPDESFFTESQVTDGKCPECGREVVRANEEAYFFRLGKYQQRLEDHIEKNPNFIFPESRKKEMLNNFIRPGLQDLCVSRSSFKWGVPVPFDNGHVIYVWIDALSNYITAMGYDAKNPSEMYNKYWPADVHVIGKDILRFHTIYWPCILMALGEELPLSVFGHPWLLSGEDKMSKSRGNVIYADELADLIGVDAVRYYMLSEMPYAQDGTITYERIFERYNSDLANTLGNLVNRSIAMTQKYFEGSVPSIRTSAEIDGELKEAAKVACEKVVSQLAAFRCADSLDALMTFAHRANKYIDETTPWLLAKNEEDHPRLAEVLYNLLETIRVLGVLLMPFLPATSEEIFRQINCPTELQNLASAKEFGAWQNVSVGQPVPLFARLDTAEMLKNLQIPTQQEAPPEPIEHLAEIGIEDFMAVELLCAEVLLCEAVPKAKKLLKLVLFDGERERTVVSGIAECYAPADLVGKKVALVANLKPVKLRGILSEGMLLAADGAAGVQVVFLANDAVPGSRIR